MTQYIDKSALVAEIEKRKKSNREICTAEESGAYYEDGFILDIINSLEVKEVDKNNEFVDKLKDIINFHREKVFKGQWYKWMPEKISYHNGIISGIKQCLSIIRNR